MRMLIHLKICIQNNFIMFYASKKQKSRVVNSESSSHETDATLTNASGLVSDDEHGKQLVRPQENLLRENETSSSS
ncbi:hypothetical protein MTR_2g091340 [Medicago truncatula]|uniref:Uncharacterized protein n=1 Tax=Medicago truncatula TaxID=3880 RepID=A0A072VBY0_MEDTR|nr:hypothetical protein MTR_2g091340 [Medicago truncatula]